MKNVARHTVVLFAFILLCAGATAHSAGVDMKEGEWETSSETSMTMGAMSMPSRTDKVTKCLTREDLVPKTEKEKDCRMVKQKVVGNTVSWRMECKKSEGEGEITYSGTTYKGFFNLKAVEDGQTMTMKIKLAGKYLGPCPKGQKSVPTGEEKHAVGRVESGRVDSGRVDSAKESEGDSAIDENKILKDPVKGIRNLFGF